MESVKGVVLAFDGVVHLKVKVEQTRLSQLYIVVESVVMKELDQKFTQSQFKDRFHTYLGFPDERLNTILTGWDGLGGIHGLVVKYCAKLLQGISVLDVGCGGCHLYDALKDEVALENYVGVDNDQRVLEHAKQRHPDLQLYYASVYDLSVLRDRQFDTVYAVGLFTEINREEGVMEMLKHTKQCLVLTYKNNRISFTEPFIYKFPDPLWTIRRSGEIKSIEILAHNIHRNIEILRLNK